MCTTLAWNAVCSWSKSNAATHVPYIRHVHKTCLQKSSIFWWSSLVKSPHPGHRLGSSWGCGWQDGVNSFTTRKLASLHRSSMLSCSLCLFNSLSQYSRIFKSSRLNMIMRHMLSTRQNDKQIPHLFNTSLGHCVGMVPVMQAKWRNADVLSLDSNR